MNPNKERSDLRNFIHSVELYYDYLYKLRDEVAATEQALKRQCRALQALNISSEIDYVGRPEAKTVADIVLNPVNNFLFHADKVERAIQLVSLYEQAVKRLGTKILKSKEPVRRLRVRALDD